MKNQYTSSILTKYGDVENVKNDVKTLKEILGRQGSSLLIDVMSNAIGEVVLKYRLSELDVKNIKKNILAELSDSIDERT